jgi:cytochrome c oxidase assembly factor CtaG/cytochrome c2
MPLIANRCATASAGCLLVTLATVASRGPAFAHDGTLAPATSDSAVLPIAILALFAVVYAAGAVRLERGRGAQRVAGGGRLAAMGAGLAVLAAALISPLQALADRLVSAHMLQHLLLMLLAAPLVVWGRPLTVSMWALPRGVRRAFGRARMTPHLAFIADMGRRPAVAWMAFSGSIAFWHLPAFYRMAGDDALLHALMHLTFLGAGLLFWSVVLEPSGRRRLDYSRTIVFVFSTAMATGLAGALLSFAQKPIYHAADAPAVLGLTSLEDQRLAGLIMWIPMDLVLFCVAGALFVAWLSSTERRQLFAGTARVATPPVILILALLCGCDQSGTSLAADAGERENRGISLIVHYGCGSCHEIPGIRSANGVVGPPLEQFGRRVYVAGMLRNSPENLAAWLRNPQAIIPGNAMPDMGMSEADARAIADYLLTLE